MLAKSKLNGVKFLISQALINSNSSHGEFALIDNVLKEYDKVKKQIKHLKPEPVYQRF